MRDSSSDLARALVRARTPKKAAETIARALEGRFPVDRVSVRIWIRDEHVIRVAALWSRFETKVSEGTRIAEGASSLPEVLEADAPLVVEDAAVDRLLDQVLRDEGLQSWVTIPLRAEGEIVGLLSVSSRTSGGFSRGDGPFFAELARAIEGPILELVGEKR